MLYEEVDLLLKEEFREPDIYKTILSAIASGSTKVAEIADKSGIKVSNMDRYLKSLIRLGIIKKRDSSNREKKQKNALYNTIVPVLNNRGYLCLSAVHYISFL